MKIAISMLLFLICLNLSSYTLAKSEIYPGSYKQYTKDELFANLTLPDILVAGGLTIAGILISLVTHTFIGPAILILWGLGYLTNMGKWLLGGFPEMLTMLGLPSYISDVGYVIMAFAMFILIIEITTQRDLT